MLKIISDTWLAMGRLAALEYGVIIPELAPSECCGAEVATEAGGMIEVCSSCRAVTRVYSVS